MGATSETPFDNPLPARSTARARRDRGSRRVSFRPYSAEDLGKLLATLAAPRNDHERRWYPMTEFMLLTGLRYGEPAALRWSDVDRSASTIILQRGRPQTGPTPIDKPTKTGFEWRISMTPRIAALMQRQRTASFLTGNGWIFPTGTGTTQLYSNWNRRTWQPLLTRAKVEKRDGDAQKALRRTYICSALVCGRNPKLVSAELGHATARMITDQYDAFLDPTQWPPLEERLALQRVYGWTEDQVALEEIHAEK